MSSVTQSESVPTTTVDVVALRLVLACLGIACLAEFWYANSHTEDYRLQSPLFTPRMWNSYLTFKLASVVGLIGMWNWHKWGLKLFAVMAIAQLFTEFYTAESYSIAFLFISLRIPLTLAMVWYLSQRVWNRFA